MHVVNLAIMFTDMTGYTAKTSVQSRADNQKMLNTHNAILLPLVKSFGGRHVKSIGDALLCVFVSPTDSLLCAMAMQDALFDYNKRKPEEEQIHIKVGLNIGEVRLEHKDVFGDAVNVASRIQNITPTDEIYFSDVLHAAMNKAEVPAAVVGMKSLKGLQDEIKIWQIPRFSSPTLVPAQVQQNADIAEIAYPYGGAHTRVPKKRFTRIMLELESQSWFTLTLLLLLVAVTLLYFITGRTVNTAPQANNKAMVVAEKESKEAPSSSIQQTIITYLKEYRQEQRTLASAQSTGTDSAELIYRKLRVEQISKILPQLQALQQEIDKEVAVNNSKEVTSLANKAEILFSLVDQLTEVRALEKSYYTLHQDAATAVPAVQRASSVWPTLIEEINRGKYTEIAAQLSTIKDDLNFAITLEKKIQSLSASDSSIENLNSKGHDFYSTLKYVDALVYFTKAFRTASSENYSDISPSLVATYEEMARYEDALIILETVSKRYSGDFWTFLASGRVSLKLKNYEKAKLYFNTAIDIRGEDDERFGVLYGLAQAYEGLGEKSKALDLYKQSLSLLTSDANEGSEETTGTLTTLKAKINELTK